MLMEPDMKILMRQHFTRWLILAGTGILLFSGTAVLLPMNHLRRLAARWHGRLRKQRDPGITVDHSRLPALNKPFKSGPEITKACQSCHTEAEAQFHQTIHWTWKADDNVRGKAGYSVNNFCISANKMQDKGCLSCHPGWNKSMDSINCLVCHGQKDINWEESFQDLKEFSDSKDPEEAEIAKEIRANIQTAAQSVGLPGRKNCGSCHFYGGGGDGVKHGDLDSSLAKPNKALDVHMGTDGQDFSCTDVIPQDFTRLPDGFIRLPPPLTERVLLRTIL